MILAGALVLSLASCKDNKTQDNEKDTGFVVDNEDNNKDDKKNGTVYENVDLEAVANSLYNGLGDDEKPYVATTVLDKETFEIFAFIPYEETFSAVVNEPMMSSIAHSIVLVKCESEEKATEVAKQMKENCNPRKWLCVEADIVEGVTNGNIAMLLMTTTEGGMSKTILDNFAKLDEKTIASLKTEKEDVENTDDENETVIDDGSDFGEDGSDNEEIDADKNVVIELPEIKVDNTPAASPDKADTDNKSDNEEIAKTEPIITTPEVLPEKEETNGNTEEPKENTDDKADQNVNDEMSEDEAEALYELADKLYNGISEDDLPFMGVRELGEEDFQYVAFAPYKSTYTAIESAPMIGSIPHSVVVVKTESEDEAKKLATTMKENCNPRKWVCVEASSVMSAYKGKYAILVMVGVDVYDENMDIDELEQKIKSLSDERANLIINNFKSYAN